ncbi:Geranylgeranyl transferase type-1 subunit beta [Amphibalanus amphitrite]|uniref:Geranylgeranyl transferase type-1 subunit beta n=1 Tax=Amphibalanus amphitrite TaxID=1232801 RepID=A0A6A4VG13_AMPAM|nr:Geranylgeranyl transferase type-1 subunit beta [Amphibalanus amphitrite]
MPAFISSVASLLIYMSEMFASSLSSLHAVRATCGSCNCAAAVSYMLDDWSGMDREKTREYVLRSMVRGAKPRFEVRPRHLAGTLLESHGGSTFCAVATLALMGELDSALHRTTARRPGFLVSEVRQGLGFNGRPNKQEDSCYTLLDRRITQGISGLSLAGQEGLKPIHAALNVSADAVEVLRRAQARWRDLPPVKAVD